MALEISITETSGNLLKKLPNAKRIVGDAVAAGLDKASALLWREAILNTPKSTGTLAKSIMRDIEPTHAKIYPTLMYGLYVHEGTKPHGIPKSEIQPGGSLYRWAKKKGIDPYLVARAIARKGTKAQPWLAQTMDKSEKAVIDLFEDALNKAVNALT